VTKVIGVISGKGGVGKTTLVTNVGTILAQEFGKDVTIVDCNLTTSHLGMYMGFFFVPVTLNNVLRNEASIEEAIYKHASGVKIVPASLNINDLNKIDVFDIQDVVKQLSDKTEIIFLDSAPGLGREAMGAIKACDEVIYITTPYLPCISDVVRCKEVVDSMKKTSLGLVVNMVTGKGNELKKEEIESITSLPVLASIPFDKAVKSSLELSVPVYSLDPYSKASRELLRLSAMLIGAEYRENLISRIFRMIKFW